MRKIGLSLMVALTVSLLGCGGGDAPAVKSTVTTTGSTVITTNATTTTVATTGTGTGTATEVKKQ